MKKEDNYFGVASVILGILSLVFAFAVVLGSLGGLILGVIGLIFAIAQNKRMKNKWATWGMALSIIGIVINVVIFVLLVSTLAEFVRQFQEASGGSLVQ